VYVVVVLGLTTMLPETDTAVPLMVALEAFDVDQYRVVEPGKA
jgi:hypothetical protein